MFSKIKRLSFHQSDIVSFANVMYSNLMKPTRITRYWKTKEKVERKIILLKSDFK